MQTSATFLNAKANKSLAVPFRKLSLPRLIEQQIAFYYDFFFFASSVFETYFSISFWICCPAALICVRRPLRQLSQAAASPANTPGL